MYPFSISWKNNHAQEVYKYSIDIDNETEGQHEILQS